MTPQQGEDILDAGADVITMGNHTFGKREIVNYLEVNPRILRPANYAPQVPGRGWGVYESKFGPVAVIDLIGRCGMDFGPDNPFLMVEKILPKIDAKFILVEIHAEATSEKLAMGYMLDGKASAVWGTHTHVPTADTQVLPKGTGYVTDLGMTGPRHSVLGIRPDLSISKFRGDLYQRYQWADGPTKLEAVLFTIDTATTKCVKAERVDVTDENPPRR
jgi:metallophosphoesterase (TIGR00282 family)